jgi:hypothetical protein
VERGSSSNSNGPQTTQAAAASSSSIERKRTYNMSLDPPTYLASLQSNIRQRPIPWDGAVRAGTLTEDQLAKIRAVDKVKKDARKQTVEADLDGYRQLFVGGPGKKSVLELAAKQQNVVQYILVLLSDLLESAYLPPSSSCISQGASVLPAIGYHRPYPPAIGVEAPANTKRTTCRPPSSNIPR